MDINRVPNEKKLELCRWYFRGEFLNIQEALKVRIIFKFKIINFSWFCLPAFCVGGQRSVVLRNSIQERPIR